MAGDDASVSYTVRELIGRVDAKLDLVLEGLAGKASVAALDRIDGKIVELAGRLTSLESEAASTKAVASNTRWMLFSAVPVVIGLAVTISNIIS